MSFMILEVYYSHQMSPGAKVEEVEVVQGTNDGETYQTQEEKRTTDPSFYGHS